MKIFVAGACTVLAVIMVAGVGTSALGEKATIKEVMGTAHKKGLLKKVVSGKADEAEKKQLLKLYTDLAANTPPAGSKEDWKAKTDPIVKAAKAVVDGDADAPKALQKAVNCMACHSAHKA